MSKITLRYVGVGVGVGVSSSYLPHHEMFSFRLASLFRIWNMHVCVFSEVRTQVVSMLVFFMVSNASLRVDSAIPK